MDFERASVFVHHDTDLAGQVEKVHGEDWQVWLLGEAVICKQDERVAKDRGSGSGDLALMQSVVSLRIATVVI